MTASSQTVGHFEQGCGARLRQAREQAGLSVEDVSRQLRMPRRVIESLESEEWGKLDAPVYVRGQLRSYARLLGLSLEDALPEPTRNPVESAPIIPMSYTPPLQRIAGKLMGRMVYIVITALIAVPVWMAARTHLLPESGTLAAQAPANAAPARSQGEPQAASQRPLVASASMASLPVRNVDKPAPAPAFSLRMTGESWVEITGRDGNRIEQALLKAGDQRDFEAGQVGRVVLGNASAVEVLHNGDVQDLSAYQRANVARFTVSSDGSLAPVTE